MICSPMRLFRYLPVLACLLALVACGRSPSAGGQTKNADPGNPHEEERLAVFSPAIGAMLQSLGDEDRIVGRHAYDTALSESIPVVGSHIEIDYEVLLTAHPTVLIFEETSFEIPQRLRDLADEQRWEIWTYRLKTLDDIATTVDDLRLKLHASPRPDLGDDPLHPDPDPMRAFEIELPSARLARAWSPVTPALAREGGRVLLLAGVDPPGVLGPGSFHAQMIERMGLMPAVTDGGMWQELDYEDLIGIAPDSIIVLMPRARDAAQQIGDPEPLTWDEISARIGGITGLPIPAAIHHKIVIIDDPLGLLPSTSLARVADEIRKTLARWRERDASP